MTSSAAKADTDAWTLELPSAPDAGASAAWLLPTQRGDQTVQATFLGLGSSRSGDHRGHDPGTVQPRRPRGTPRENWQNCHACRWTELRIFKDDDTGVYLVHTVGRSQAQDETPRPWLAWAQNPEDLYQTLQDRPGGLRQRAKLSVPALQALEMAAGHDQVLYRELVQRNQPR